MKYNDIREGRFIERPNRFIAYCEADGAVKCCHVKNTGRCRELLTPDARVFLDYKPRAQRKTEYDLIGVMKGERLINMDSNAPNAVFGEYLKEGGLGFVPDYVKPECTHGASRFDFYFEYEGKGCFAEVKGVTLEENGIVRFPDAPTARGRKHMLGLIDCVNEGYGAMAVLVIQMDNVKHFEPNYLTDPDFAESLIEAEKAGVKILALSCEVGRDTIKIKDPVPVKLERGREFQE